MKISYVLSKITTKAMQRRTEPVVKATVETYGTALFADVGHDATFNMKSPRVTKFLKDFGGNRLTKVTKTTQRRVGKLLSEALDSGKTTTEITKLITEKFDQWSVGRAASIATTEVTRASGFGSLEGMVQAAIEQKEWLATEDAVVRESHEELNGVVVDVDDVFPGGAMYPGDFGDPAEDVNCRCSILPVINDKVLRRPYRVVKASRKPWDTKMRIAFARGFGDQKAAVLAALKE